MHMAMKLRRMSFGSITRDGGKFHARAANLGSSSGISCAGLGLLWGYTCGVWGAEVWSRGAIFDSCAKLAVVGTQAYAVAAGG